jgi:leucyl aminopeptidase (aminopeptidase T)
MDCLYEFKPRNIAVLALSNKPGSIGDLGESFRTYAKEKKHRFISALSLGHLNTDQLPALINAIDVDYAELARKGKELKARLEQGKEIHITTEAGTDMYMGIEGKKAIANVGSYKLPGSGGNIPAGEVYIPPKWKNVEGKIVIDGSCAYRGGTILIKEPIKLKIEKDEIVSIKGGDEAEKLQSTLDWACKKSRYPWGVRRIGELGIGINEKANIVGATIIDEKTLGTAHIVIGSNHWFGGTIYAVIHLDQVFKNPKIEIDGELLEIK